MTISEWIQHCMDALESAGVFYGHGTDNSGDEAAWLVLSAMGIAPDGEFNDGDQAVGMEQAKAIERLLSRRISTRKPLAYLTGEAWFCGLRFRVNEQVLVPRSPISELINNGFAPWVDPGRIRRMLDMCTGSGCIAIASADKLREIRVDAVDLSAGALKVAKTNVELHKLAGRIALIESDLFKQLSGRRYDLVVSNPPYVGRSEYDSLPQEYLAEPEMGLLSEMDGLELPLKIILQSADFLTEEGVLICEVGENAEQLQSVLAEFPLTWLQFSQGGSGVFVASRATLLKHRSTVAKVMENLSDVA